MSNPRLEGNNFALPLQELGYELLLFLDESHRQERHAGAGNAGLRVNATLWHQEDTVQRIRGDS